jgi:hypothetical protein
VRALHPLLGDPERAYVLLYGSLWLWALANLSGEFALLARRCVGAHGACFSAVLVPQRCVEYVLGTNKVGAAGVARPG